MMKPIVTSKCHYAAE